jgi:soluble lytic murein transglycosylase-like protein
MKALCTILLLLVCTNASANWLAYVEKIEKAANLPQGVLTAIIKTESDFDPNAHNSDINPGTKTSSYGLAQLTLETAAECGLSQSTVLDPELNIKCAVKILKRHLSAYQDLPAVISAYNDGTPCFCDGSNWVTPLKKTCPLKTRKTCDSTNLGLWRNQSYLNKVFSNMP